MKILIALLLASVPCIANAQNWTVDSAQSTLGFSGSFQGADFHGVFKQFHSNIRFDPEHLDQARFDVSVKLASVDTQSADRDQTLKGADFFATSSHPQAHFVTTDFKRTDDASVIAHGMLKLNGVRKPVTLKVSFNRNGATATLDVDTTLNRLDFKLGTRSDWSAISKKIPVHGHLLLHATQAPAS